MNFYAATLFSSHARDGLVMHVHVARLPHHGVYFFYFHLSRLIFIFFKRRVTSSHYPQDKSRQLVRYCNVRRHVQRLSIVLLAEDSAHTQHLHTGGYPEVVRRVALVLVDVQCQCQGFKSVLDNCRPTVCILTVDNASASTRGRG